MRHAIGVDLGGTKTAGGLVSEDGEVLFRETIPTLSQDGGEAILNATAELILRIRRRAAAEGLGVAGTGVGSAGVIDAAHGTVVSATDAIRGWAGTDIAGGLSGRTGLHTAVVNDVHAHALGEAWLGAARATSSSLLLAFGTGVGGSFVVGGRPLLGHRWVGGHVGHVASPFAHDAAGSPLPCVCGSAGHVEAIASGPALHSEYLRRGGDPAVPDTKAVFERAEGASSGGGRSDGGRSGGDRSGGGRSDDGRSGGGRSDDGRSGGDSVAVAAISVAARAAGQAAGGLANILDPELIVVSGGLADAGPLWWEAMEAAFRAELMPPLAALPLVRASLGGAAALAGAARLVFSPEVLAHS
ncbi:transcriptional regulator [Sinomonas cellulolyticus]|uniref:ROK family protein n=1 Tax=Sinomonas cellulolyticus TaxID=2801916 RepID=A0ABS1K2F7_9MICC|nr:MULTISPECIES: ROK family protein [Sinomonas]MBL0705859.1 ROK family protein [Sinomonas cellulolyticus]GHG42367.1 transcriptional regulator [Sinomonas sp. KCTC 49339]